MAWASVGIAGSTGNATNNNTSIVVTLSGQVGTGANVNDFLILCVGVNNFSSVSNADEGAVTSVTDNATNTNNVWTKVREITNGNAATTVGTVCSMWATRVNTALTTSNTVTASFSNSAARDGATALVSRFTVSGGVRVADSTYLTNATSLLGSIDQTEATAGEYLRFRAIAARTTVTALTTTSGWTTMGTTRSSATVNQAIFGEWRIVSAATAASAPSITAAVANASVYAVFEEATPMGQIVL